MKAFFISLVIAITVSSVQAQVVTVQINDIKRPVPTPYIDTVKLQVDGSNAYYQKTVKVDSNITESMIYVRALQFMAAKNFQQNYGYEQDGKMICTTTQDLNINEIYIGDDADEVDPYTVQFSITLDMKNKRYRYTVSNVVFFRPTDSGNRRLTLFDMYTKASNTDSKRVAKDAKKLIASFEKYLSTFTTELYADIEQKSMIHNSKF